MADGFNYSLHQVEELCTREFGWAGEVSQNGEFVCYCPVHGDKNASLHVGLKDGKILIRCWSHGCEKQIYKDLSSRGAWPQQLESREKAERENKLYEKKYPERAQPRFKWNSYQVSHVEAVKQSRRLKDTLQIKDKNGGPPTTFVKTHVHVYTDGEFAQSIVARYDAAGKKKRILQYSYGYYDEHEDPSRPTDPNNPRWQVKGWSSSVNQMIYALTYVNANDTDTVIVVEGEKAADYGNSHIKHIYPNYVFTTWKGGTQSVPYTDWSSLRGRRVIVLPDADAPGVESGVAVYNALKDIAESVDIVDILKFDVPEKWDIADYPDKNSEAPKFLDLIGEKLDNNFVKEEAGKQDRKEIKTDRDSEDEFFVNRTVFWYRDDGGHKDAANAFFNEKYGVLNEGGRLNVIDLKGVRENPESAVMPEATFHAANQHIRIQLLEKGAAKPASKFWLTSDHRRFDVAAVDPTKGNMFVDHKNRTCINLWPGIEAEEMDQSGSCEKFLNHIKFVCSSEDEPEELERFIIVFLARMIQAPHKRQGAILLFRGKQGSGKSIIGEYLRRMLGDKAAITVNKLDRVTGQFNSQLTGRLLCRVEEAKIPKNENYEALKDLSVNPTFTMEAKGKSQVTRDNFIHFIFTGNYDYIAPVSDRERRLVPVDVPDTRIGDTEYFNAIIEEMTGGGPGALYKYLKEYPLPSSFLPIPQTLALSSQRSQTKSYSREASFLDWYAKSLKNGGLQSGPSGPTFLPWKQGQEHDRSVFWNAFEAWQKENVRSQDHISRRFFYRYLEEFQYGQARMGKEIKNSKTGRFASRYSGTQLLAFPDIKEAKNTFMAYVGQDDTYDVFNKEDAQESMDMQELNNTDEVPGDR